VVAQQSASLVQQETPRKDTESEEGGDIGSLMKYVLEQLNNPGEELVFEDYQKRVFKLVMLDP